MVCSAGVVGDVGGLGAGEDGDGLGGVDEHAGEVGRVVGVGCVAVVAVCHEVDHLALGEGEGLGAAGRDGGHAGACADAGG